MRIAINRQLVNKPSQSDITRHHNAFINLDLTAAELAAEISQGFAFCPQHEPGRRNSKGFTGAGYLAVDIDHGLTLETVRADEYFQRHATLLYTTASHAPGAHRFRIVFELEQPITDAHMMEEAMTGLIARFGSDRSCKDACRMFFGFNGSSPELLPGKLSVGDVEALRIRTNEREVMSDSTGEDSAGRRSAVRSRIDIPPNTVVRLQSGTTLPLKEVPNRTRIFCPRHVDNHPSAVTLRNKHGNAGLFCSACNATYFLDDGRRGLRQDYEFDYQWRSILNVSWSEFETHADDAGHVDLSVLRGGRIRVLDQRYLKFDELAASVIQKRSRARGQVSEVPSAMAEVPDAPTPGLIADCDISLVKSPKGSGKTEWLKSLVRAYVAQDVPVLLIGHRRALISATAERIGLTSYLGDAGSEEARAFGAMPDSHYAICVDSLPKMDTRNHRYDVIVIDEVEQVLSHLLSSTLRDHRREALHVLRHYLNSAKALYLLDADLNRVTFDLIGEMLDERKRSYQAIVNLWQPQERNVFLYDSPKPDHLIGELVASLERGERCFVCSNSKKLIDELKEEVKKQIARPIKSIAITSDNSQKPATQGFIRNIKTRALEYDVIFTSPALGTGIDITFEDDASHIDAVFGFFQARINTHFDIDQQLSRVRNPKRVSVWVSGDTFRFETDADVIRAELQASEAEHRQIRCIDADGTKRYHEDPLYETVFSTITSAQRASKNRLRHHFIKLRESNGWKVEIIGHDKAASVVGRDVRIKGKEARKQIDVERILMAKPISSEEFERLKQAETAEKLRDGDAAAIRRYVVESFYRQEVDKALLEDDDEGNLRNAIRAYQDLLAPNEELERRDRYTEDALVPDKPQSLLRKQLISTLLEKARVMKAGAFDRDARIDAPKLDDFCNECWSQKVAMERLFNLTIRRDVRTKPTSQLRDVLKLIGLNLTQDRRDQSGGKSKVIYRLNIDALDRLEKWAGKRSDPATRQAWEQAHRARIKVLETQEASGHREPEADEEDKSIHLVASSTTDPLDRR